MCTGGIRLTGVPPAAMGDDGTKRCSCCTICKTAEAGESGDGGCEIVCGIWCAAVLTDTLAAASRSRKSESNDVSLGVRDTAAVSISLIDACELGNDGMEAELRWPGEVLCRRL